MDGDELIPKIYLLLSLSIMALIILFLCYGGFNFLVLKSPRFKNFIFRHQSLVCLQRFVIRRDTTIIFPDGFRPSGIIARAPTLYKVNRSLEQSTDSSKSEIDATSERGSSSAEELSF
jgi:hypothetical protein